MPARTPEELAQTFAQAINEGRLEPAVELWDEDAAIVMADGQALTGRDGVAAALGALIANGTRMELDIEHVYTAAELAVVTGSLTLRGDGAQPFEATSRSIVVYRRRDDGEWRIVLDAPWGLPAAA